MRFLLEHHKKDCTCSYCEKHEFDGSLSFGFLSPIEKSWNSWRVLFHYEKVQPLFQVELTEVMTEAEILKKHLSKAGKKGYAAMRKKLTPELKRTQARAVKHVGKRASK